MGIFLNGHFRNRIFVITDVISRGYFPKYLKTCREAAGTMDTEIADGSFFAGKKESGSRPLERRR